MQFINRFVDFSHVILNKGICCPFLGKHLLRLLTPRPALLLEKGERVLIVTDLHIGFEYELAKMGISIPYQTNRLLNELLNIVLECKPHRLIILGDLKHGIPIASFQEKREIPNFLEALSEMVNSVEVVRGNHDGGIQNLVPENVKIHSSRGILLGDDFKVALFHGHAWPNPKLMVADTLVMGHNHPTVLLRTPLGIRFVRRVWVRGPCEGECIASSFLKKEGLESTNDALERFEEIYSLKIEDPQMILMPAFNNLLGGLPINSEVPKSLLGPLLRTGAINISEFEVYLLDGTFLGKNEFLTSLT